MTTIRVVFFFNLGHFIPVFEKGQGRPPPSPSPSLFTRLRIVSYKIYMIFLPFFNLHIVQKNEQAKLYS